LAITLASETPSVRLLAGLVVVRIIAPALVILYFAHLGRPWSYVGAAALGAFGVTLRLIVNAQPQLEVGGGLPVAVTVLYTGIGVALVVSSVWAYLKLQGGSLGKSALEPNSIH
jgi:hypothetical protein